MGLQMCEGDNPIIPQIFVCVQRVFFSAIIMCYPIESLELFLKQESSALSMNYALTENNSFFMLR